MFKSQLQRTEVKQQMKKRYSTPTIEVLGTVESLTQHYGSPTGGDVIYEEGQDPVPGRGGSQDAIIVPIP
jgi:hypothetical protein